ncbi:hypothetical protein HPB52_003621 [Rhipicephalus sanguineus]|uniref:Uncharacterized protein n=1 Tax=Rhipicephalus sanguineus TaxID=34632 RepID=A0A9D4PTV0_RHISA|nr:hypothetical protein HPB52_003621 [Rhipicephalus sanguineus]
MSRRSPTLRKNGLRFRVRSLRRSTSGERAFGFQGRVLELTGTLRLTGVRPLDYHGDPESTPFGDRPAVMLPSLCPPVKPFNPAYPRAWFLQLDATLAMNGVTAQPLMHAVLLSVQPVELRHLAAASTARPQLYDDPCAAVLACYGETYRPPPVEPRVPGFPYVAARGTNWPAAFPSARLHFPGYESFYLTSSHQRIDSRARPPARRVDLEWLGWFGYLTIQNGNAWSMVASG